MDNTSLMTLLDQKKMEILENNFLDYPKGIPYDRFIKLMRRVISVDKVKMIEFYLGLKTLFEDIDINNDKILEWSEFTGYMIDTVIATKKAQTMLKERCKAVYNLVEKTGVDPEAEKIVQNAYFTAEFSYFIHNFGKDLVFENPVIKLKYCQKAKVLMILWECSNMVVLKNTNYDKVTAFYITLNGKRSLSNLVDFDYDEEASIVCLVLYSDRIAF